MISEATYGPPSGEKAVSVAKLLRFPSLVQQVPVACDLECVLKLCLGFSLGERGANESLIHLL